MIDLLAGYVICQLFASANVMTYLRAWLCRNFALRSWEETVPTFKYNPAVPYSNIFVPTADTVRFAALLTLALQAQRPVLLTGIAALSYSDPAVYDICLFPPCPIRLHSQQKLYQDSRALL